MSVAKDLYDSLGVTKDASAAAIKKAYRQLAKELHPDRNPDDTKAEERFKEVSNAYAVLSDPKKRALYDEFGEVGLREGFDPEVARARAAGGAFDFGGFGGGGAGFGGFGFDLNDLFRGAPRGRQQTARPKDVEAQIRLTFLDALRGGEHQLTLHDRSGPRSLKVRLPAGVRDGERVRLKGQGASMGSLKGDLVLNVKVLDDERFWYEGGELHLRLPVRPLEAFEGAKVQLSTPGGKVSVKLPKRATNGTKLRVRGKGAQRGKKPGDLIVHVEVVLPTNDAAEAATRALDDALGTQDVRSELPDF